MREWTDGCCFCWTGSKNARRGAFEKWEDSHVRPGSPLHHQAYPHFQGCKKCKIAVAYPNQPLDIMNIAHDSHGTVHERATTTWQRNPNAWIVLQSWWLITITQISRAGKMQGCLLSFLIKKKIVWGLFIVSGIFAGGADHRRGVVFVHGENGALARMGGGILRRQCSSCVCPPFWICWFSLTTKHLRTV